MILLYCSLIWLATLIINMIYVNISDLNIDFDDYLDLKFLMFIVSPIVTIILMIHYIIIKIIPKIYNIIKIIY